MITHPCHNFNGALAQLPLKLGQAGLPCPDFRAQGPWKPKGAPYKILLDCAMDLLNWITCNVFPERVPPKFVWGPWKFQWWGPRALDKNVYRKRWHGSIITSHRKLRDKWTHICHNISMLLAKVQSRSLGIIPMRKEPNAIMTRGNLNTCQSEFILGDSQFYGCRSPGNARIRGISSIIVIDQVIPEYSGFTTVIPLPLRWKKT